MASAATPSTQICARFRRVWRGKVHNARVSKNHRPNMDEMHPGITVEGGKHGTGVKNGRVICHNSQILKNQRFVCFFA